jgi:hypothetical protein
MRIRPSVGGTKPRIAAKVVDLPEALGVARWTVSPGLAVKDTPFGA